MKFWRILVAFAVLVGGFVGLSVIVLVLLVVGLAARFRRRPPPIATEQSDVLASVVVLNWNGRDFLAECLPSVVDEAARTPGEIELIVVDNASTDGSADFVEAHFPAVRVLRQSSNLRFTGGCNAGAIGARGKYVVILNNDMKVEPGFLAALLAGFDDPSTFAVTSQIFLWDRERRREETGKTRGLFSAGRVAVTHDEPGPSDPVLHPVFYAGGGSAAFDRSKFLALGGFDSLYDPFYYEDTDLSYRAWKRGWTSLINRESIVLHKHRGTNSRNWTAGYIQSIVDRNALLFVWKNVSDPWILGTQAVSQPLLAFYGVLHGKPSYQPLISAARKLPTVLRGIWNERRYEYLSDRAVVAASTSPLVYRERLRQPKAVAIGERLRIVFMSPYALNPPSHGGAVRMYNVLIRLARRHDVTLLSFVDNEDEAERTMDLEQYCSSVTAVVRRPDLRRHNPFGPNPLCCVEFDSPIMRQALQGARIAEVDVLQIEYIDMAHFVQPSRHTLNVLTEMDVTFLRMYRAINTRAHLALKVLDWLAWLKMFNYELAKCRVFDLVVAVTKREEQLLRSYLPGSAISSAAPLGTDLDYFQPRRQAEVNPRSILFVGYFRHPPNVDAARFLGDEIFPLVKRICPDATLTIVGAYPTAEVRALEGQTGISVTGFVPDVRDFYQSHAVLAAPIRTGAGVRVKVLEALAAGVPVVTTTIGAEGIQCVPGRDLLIGDTAEQFAAAIVDVLTQPERATALARSGRALVEEYYDWDKIVENLEAEYYKHLAIKRNANGRITTKSTIRSSTEGVELSDLSR